MKKPTTIIFDLGGVLIDLDRQRCIDAFCGLGVTSAADLLDPYRQSGIFLALEAGTVTPEEFYTVIREEAAKDISTKDIDSALNKFLLDIPDYKLNMLLDLRKKGYRVLMLSNTNIIMMEYMMKTYFRKQGLTVDDYFDHLYLSYEMGCVKPDNAIFEKLIADSGITPSETLFLDDGPANIKVGAQFGLQTYLVKPQEDFRHIFDTF